MIVPEENLVHIELRMCPPADKSQDIASEEHLNYANTTIKI